MHVREENTIHIVYNHYRYGLWTLPLHSNSTRLLLSVAIFYMKAIISQVFLPF